MTDLGIPHASQQRMTHEISGAVVAIKSTCSMYVHSSYCLGRGAGGQTMHCPLLRACGLDELGSRLKRETLAKQSTTQIGQAVDGSNELKSAARGGDASAAVCKEDGPGAVDGHCWVRHGRMERPRRRRTRGMHGFWHDATKKGPGRVMSATIFPGSPKITALVASKTGRHVPINRPTLRRPLPLFSLVSARRHHAVPVSPNHLTTANLPTTLLLRPSRPVRFAPLPVARFCA